MNWQNSRELRLFRGKPQYCGEKVKYSKKDALTAKNRRYSSEHIQLRIYQCPNCNGWHLTHKNPHNFPIRVYGPKYG